MVSGCAERVDGGGRVDEEVLVKEDGGVGSSEGGEKVAGVG